MNTPLPIADDRLTGILAFLQSAERLKDTLRSGHTSSGRAESTAEHCWRLCLLVMLFQRELPGIDMLRLLKLCVIHDLGEAISGDTPAPEQMQEPDRKARERRDLDVLCTPLPEDLRAELIALWDEYSDIASPEAEFAKGFDKLETMFQHVVGSNGPTFDYAFNLGYGLADTARHPLLARIRAEADRLTRERSEQCLRRQSAERDTEMQAYSPASR